ncbi:MAG: hypothetical protein M3296_03355 [Actinomycetota bacterium]|nr:hypothetical protein [Actinomycetota bacterium]
MASLDRLPADQRAVLQLLLKQGKSYDDLADLLRIDATAVRERAHAAIAAVGPVGNDVGADRRGEIADYLLGQQSASQRAATREYLEGSAAGRSWTRAAATALKPLAGENLPDAPAERAEVEEAFDALDRRSARRREVERSSRTGGIIVVLALSVIIAVGLVLLLSMGGDGGGGGSGGSSTAPTATSTTPSAASAARRFQILLQAVLTPPRGRRSNAIGAAFVVRVRKSGQLKLAIDAQGLAPSEQGSAYGVWFSNPSGSARFLGFIQSSVGRNGRLSTAPNIDAAPGDFREFLLTRETRQNPPRPGEIVLRGRFAAPSAGRPRTGTSTQPGR